MITPEFLVLAAQVSAMFSGLQFAFYALVPWLIPKYLPLTEGGKNEIIRIIGRSKFVKKFRINWGFYSSLTSSIFFISSTCIALYWLQYGQSSIIGGSLIMGGTQLLSYSTLSFMINVSLFYGFLFFFVSIIIISNSVLGEYRILKFSDYIQEAIQYLGYHDIEEEEGIVDELSFVFDLEDYKAYINRSIRNLLFLIENEKNIEKMLLKMRNILLEDIKCYSKSKERILFLKKRISETQDAQEKFNLNQELEKESEVEDYYRNPRIVFSRKVQFAEKEIERLEKEKDKIRQKTGAEVFLHFWDEASLLKEIMNFF